MTSFTNAMKKTTITILLPAFLVSCQSYPQFYGTFEERSISFPQASASELKNAFRKRGWKITASGMATETTYNSTGYQTRQNPSSRYTILFSNRDRDFSLGLMKVGSTEFSIIDNQTSEEICTYQCGTVFHDCISADAFVEKVEQHTRIPD